MAQRMKSSLESTLHALTVFVDSLEKSGFKKAIPEYRQLQHVLIQQRLWADGRSRKELEPLWGSIAKQSDNLYQIMKPFAEIMNDLKLLDKIKAKSKDDQDEIKKVESKINSLKADLAELRQDITILKKVSKHEISRLKTSQAKNGSV